MSDVPNPHAGTCRFKMAQGKKVFGEAGLAQPRLIALNTGLSLKVFKPAAIQLKKNVTHLMKSAYFHADHKNLERCKFGSGFYGICGHVSES